MVFDNNVDNLSMIRNFDGFCQNVIMESGYYINASSGRFCLKSRPNRRPRTVISRERKMRSAPLVFGEEAKF